MLAGALTVAGGFSSQQNLILCRVKPLRETNIVLAVAVVVFVVAALVWKLNHLTLVI